ncbi:hypothetical protein E6C76_16560 [Pseudothauera nasutitermitis]|uniref:Uncharacterized protein n=1 Tax=Pseudothauera nasutitermitis TaxID=2565930 RepID=A0A4S4ASP9_9RHOO|nr:hypothetical protein [Pseudothauera nasutitermitis]THF62877.1 hypothetical protein E6C76_16560 [Pseudothauera nasutitermitis]
MTALSPADLAELAFRLCTATRPMPGHAMLLDAFLREGGLAFTPRLSRGGWYRPGRILDGRGECIAEDALAWLEEAWAEAGEDGDTLLDRLHGRGYQLTREQGITHYLVSIRGDAPTAYLQLEIEELREVLSHPLDACSGAESVAALFDRPDGQSPLAPLGKPRYSFRRLTDIAEHLERIGAQAGKPAPVMRFLDEWARSSAGQQRHFCDKWVLALSEHLDRYRQVRHGAVPVAAHAPAWQGTEDARGTELAQQLHDFDRAAGYGFAWYFHMVSGRRVPRGLPARVHADLQEDLAYLPQRDIALVSGWVEAPYSI